MKWVADFETITDKSDLRIWAFAICQIRNEDNIYYGTTMEEFLDLIRGEEFSTIYFHNLKFDGEFIISWLFKHGYKHFKDKKHLQPGEFNILMSDKGQFYSMDIYFKSGEKVSILDSLKLLTMPVRDIATAFNLEILKGEIDYKEYRPVGHKLTDEEIAYIKNDVQIVSIALSHLFDEKLTKMTQGSNALNDFKNIFGKKQFEKTFPEPLYDEQIRKAYKGGFTYLNPIHRGKNQTNVEIFDVNSLYPSVMYNCLLPYGDGVYFTGEYEADKRYPLYIQRMKCVFELKDGKIPTIQLKHTMRFCETEYLEDSDGEQVELNVTNVDLNLIKEHYNLYAVEYLDGFKFKAAKGFFKDYIDKWMGRKIQAGKDGNKPLKQIAKLMLNSLYGKFALNPKVRGKYPTLAEDGSIKYVLGSQETRKGLYLPMGIFITSYARDKTIRTSQKIKSYSIEKYGKDMYIYSDTDSIHTTLPLNECKKFMEIDDLELGYWAHENHADKARFLRQKCYMEEIDGKLNITVAGMPNDCKYKAVKDTTVEKENRTFVPVTFDNFYPGLVCEGKLQPKHYSGGILLEDVDFTIKI